MTQDILMLAAQCGAPVTFDDMQLALAFVRMLAHSIAPEQFVAVAKALLGVDAAEVAAKLADQCMGAAS